MWTQRDQLQAYQFLRRRLVSALVVGDANHPVSPSRRLVIGCIVGLACTLLTVAGFGIYGVLRPGASQDWRKPGQVVLDSASGANYVLGKDGRLYPMANQASARLFAGSATTVSVSSKSLAGAPRGATLGLPGAPDALPRTLLPNRWTVCSQQPADRPTDTTPVTTALVGVAPAVRSLPTGLVVVDPGDHRWLLAQGHRFRLADDTIAVALSYDRVVPLPVSWSFVDAVPAGPDLGPLPVDGAGAAGPRLAGRSTRVGQVVQVSGQAGNLYLVEAGGLAPVDALPARLVLATPANAAAYPGGDPAVLTVPPAAVAQAHRLDQVFADRPARLPAATAADPAAAVCLSAAGPTGVVTALWLAARPPLPAGARPVAVLDGAATTDRTADQILVAPGTGLLAAERQSGGAPAGGTTYLVTDQGVRFPVASGAALTALGYKPAQRNPVASILLALLPVGPALDPVAAARPES
jgi:type VII secretion protein EccB